VKERERANETQEHCFSGEEEGSWRGKFTVTNCTPTWNWVFLVHACISLLITTAWGLEFWRRAPLLDSDLLFDRPYRIVSCRPPDQGSSHFLGTERANFRSKYKFQLSASVGRAVIVGELGLGIVGTTWLRISLLSNWLSLRFKECKRRLVRLSAQPKNTVRLLRAI